MSKSSVAFAPGRLFTVAIPRTLICTPGVLPGTPLESRYAEDETVAVETTAAFVKRIQLPFTLQPGLYTAVSSLRYPDQEQPAIAKFPFLIEQKIAGIYKNDLIFYVIVVFSTMIVMLIGMYFFVRQKQYSRTSCFEYGKKSKKERVYYEMVSDIIGQMRMRKGDVALDMAQDIPDLDVTDAGYIENMKGDPAKIMALLISRFEKLA